MCFISLKWSISHHPNLQVVALFLTLFLYCCCSRCHFAYLCDTFKITEFHILGEFGGSSLKSLNKRLSLNLVRVICILILLHVYFTKKMRNTLRHR